MQCSPPFCSTGFPNHFGQYCSYNHAFSVPQPFYPEIIGEGEVASVAFPDGSVHMYFVPFNKRPHPFSNSYGPYCNNTLGAYYVRGIFPMSPALFNQQCQKMHSSLSTHPRSCYIPDCNSNIPIPGFQLKFHNDCCTSTSDLHYFSPCLRRTDWLPLTQPKECASVQVDIPIKESQGCHQETVCAKPCLCRHSKEKAFECESVDECCCMKSVHSANSVVYKHKQDLKKSRASKQKKKLEKRKSDVVCECRQASTNDKSIVTVADCGSTCVAENERNTQTVKSSCASSPSARSDLKAEIWFPKTPLAREMETKSCEKIIGLYDKRSSDSCCCSDAERLTN